MSCDGHARMYRAGTRCPFESQTLTGPERGMRGKCDRFNNLFSYLTF